MVEKFRPGPTRIVFLGQPSSGFLVGYWHTLRFTVDMAVHASNRPRRSVAQCMVVSRDVTRLSETCRSLARSLYEPSASSTPRAGASMWLETSVMPGCWCALSTIISRKYASSINYPFDASNKHHYQVYRTRGVSTWRNPENVGKMEEHYPPISPNNNKPRK
jgi:hypothetical protein